MLFFDNDKFSFSEYSPEAREEMIDAVMRELGNTYAYDSFIMIVDATRPSLRTLSWDDIEASDAVYVNAGESLLDAIWELCILTYHEGNGISWEDSIVDVLSQIREVPV